jgi:DNA-binding HxlR family transcriptional regulator
MSKRSYRQFCLLAGALDLVGERWTLLIVRELMLGPRRFKDLVHGLPGMGTNLLSARLKDLEASGILHRATLPPPAGSRVYELTQFGRGLGPVLAELVRWGAGAAVPPRGEVFRAEWAALAFRIMFRPDAAVGMTETHEFHVDGEVFFARVDDGAVETGPGPAPNSDLVVTTDPATLLAVWSGRLPASDAIADGRLSYGGDAAALQRSLTIFVLDGGMPGQSA